jgi:hypothetical protein
MIEMITTLSTNNFFLEKPLFPCTIRFKVVAKTNLLSIKVFGPLGWVLSASPRARLEWPILDEVKHHSGVKWVCQCELPSSLQLVGFQVYLEENNYFNS